MKSSLEWVFAVGDSKPEGDVRIEKDKAGDTLRVLFKKYPD
jgi:hypothetical protein